MDIDDSPRLPNLDCGCASLRPWRADDLGCLQANASAATLAAGEIDAFPYPYLGVDGRRWLAQAVDATDRMWAIDLDGVAVGGVSLDVAATADAAQAELGYWLGRDYWGRGLMTMILRAFVPCAMATLGFARVFATVYEDRAASARVLQKCGFTHESTHASGVQRQGQALRISLFAIAGPACAGVA